MFVKVIWGNGLDSTYECQRVHISPVENEKNTIHISMESNDGYVRLDIDKAAKTEVYFMNNEGRTIDTYRWPIPD